ncbi:DEAD/DEAH box helicase family protein [Sphingobium limneticum]|uniref:DEAD/DEAH box helicase n=1 Tax=Sphingobium limneticum TaxID=1007511 RepID=A0A5J5I4E6_9SPHN|nr:DEAD/DEAH box helicase family protein [Sphingobium limneticum]KAA9018282.1 DEAD/DEAH box helicase [Sphingobium limneticum]KAA9030918.1 DEAD/DEAH box helicase [Sphingobium limneticum]
MDTFYYQPGPAGSGKTYQLAHWAIERAAVNEKVLIAQPTKELIRDTVKQIKRLDPDANVTALYGKKRNDRVSARTVEHLNDAKPHQGEILLVTHETLKRLPMTMRKFWHMVCDEVPSVMEHIDLKIAVTHSHATQHIATEELPGGLLVLTPGNRAALEAIQINAKEDQNIASFNRLVSTMLSGEHLVLVAADTYTDLIQNPDTRGRIDVFAVLLPEFARGYASTTFMGANITETEMFVIWEAIQNVAWQLHPDMGDKLRYQTHENGKRLTIGYLFDGRMSRRHLGSEDDSGETVFDQVTDFVARYWEGIPFLWQANATAMPSGFDYDARLPGVSHGLDKAHYKRVHNVALLSAMNRKTAAYGFLAKLGISSEQAQATLSWQNDYQAMMRCSLRDPNAVAPVRVIVGSKEGAEWIAGKFPGCVVEKLDHGISEPIKPGRPPLGDKPSKAASSKERTRASRARAKAKREAGL